MKRHEYKEIRQERGHIYRYCRTCTESKANDDRGTVAHLHYSTLQDRCASMPDFYGQFHCKNCQDKRHYVVQANRYPLLVTSSFLRGWREPYLGESCKEDERYEGDKIHIDELSIPGAKIEHLHLAFKAEYTNFEKPIDVLLAAGLNNFKRDTPDEIMVLRLQYAPCPLLHTWSTWSRNQTASPGIWVRKQ